MWAWKGSYVNERQVCITTWYWNWTRAKSMWFHYDKFWTWWWSNDTDHCDALMNQWALYTWTFDWTTTKGYLNWVLKNSKNMTYSVDSNNYSSLFSQTIQGANDPSQSFNWYMNDVIIENRARTAQEVLDYYNLTKSNYWVSESQPSSCFLAWTPVLIEWWSKPIDELNIWDTVLSYNKSTWEKEYNKVVDIIEHTETKDLLYTLDIEWQRVEATEFHKFYISDNKEDWRWEEIRNLKEWQFVFSIWWAKKINSVDFKKFDWPCYNITVENNHNYFVYDGILVHNTMSTN